MPDDAGDFTVTTIDLLRHGKPEGGDIFRGFTDVAMSELGLKQMQAAVAQQGDDYQQIVSSPMQRCLVFSDLIAQQQDIACEVVADLQEISFGDWDGQTFKAIAAQNQALFDGFWKDPIANTPPNGEPMLAFCHRIQAAFWQVVKTFEGQHILMVVHGGVIRAILQDILKSDVVALMRYEVPYASISRIKIYHDDAGFFPQLVFHNR
ncbi:MAG: histidine phosphatase family protein [Pseudomonadales bacterium]|nr:histidine phosphatase family protein [Pseudomonadales bacterium]